MGMITKLIAARLVAKAAKKLTHERQQGPKPGFRSNARMASDRGRYGTLTLWERTRLAIHRALGANRVRSDRDFWRR